jgi:hypothetical protein
MARCHPRREDIRLTASQGEVSELRFPWFRTWRFPVFQSLIPRSLNNKAVNQTAIIGVNSVLGPDRSKGGSIRKWTA